MNIHPTLKAEPTYVFCYRDLEKLVKELYDQQINILDDMIPFEQIGQNTYHEFTVGGKFDLLDSVGDPEIVQKWIETGETKLLDMSDVPEFDWLAYGQVEVRHILHRLFADGHITLGKYLMTVWW